VRDAEEVLPDRHCHRDVLGLKHVEDGGGRWETEGGGGSHHR
jgi:hypothetical protein